MDSNKPSSSAPKVVVVASTNRFLSTINSILVLSNIGFECNDPMVFPDLVKRVDAIDPALRRAGRFDALVEVSTPNEDDRLKILQVIIEFLIS